MQVAFRALVPNFARVLKGHRIDRRLEFQVQVRLHLLELYGW